MLATGVTRAGWLWGHLVNAVLGAAGLVVLFAVSMALTTGQVLGDTRGQLAGLVRAGLAQLPGVLVVGAAVVAVGCATPRWSVPVSWALMLSMLVAGPMFGPSLNLPTPVQDLSPFTHGPQAPAAGITAGPILALTAVAVGLAVTGLLVLRHRNLTLPA